MAAEGDPALLMGAKPEAPAQEDEGDKKSMDEMLLKKIFKQFDSDGSGNIDVGELKDAMRMLGVKVSANAAQKILSKIDKDGSGTIEYDEFHEFFSKIRDPAEMKGMLSEANQQYLDYKAAVEGDPNFSKKFVMPPMVISRQKYAGHNDNVESVSWLQKGMFLSSAIDGELCVWDAADASKRPSATLTIDLGCGIYSSCASDDGQKAVVGTSRKTENVCLVDIFCGKENSEAIVMKYDGHTTPAYSCCMSKDMGQIVSGSKNGHIVLHDVSRPNPIVDLPAHETTCYSCDFNNDFVCSASSDGTVKIWDLKSMKAAAVIEDAAAMGVVYQALWHGENHVVSCGDDYCIKRWDWRKTSEGPVANYFGHTSQVKCIAVSPDGYFLVSACEDGSIRVWLADERALIGDVRGAAQRKLVSKENEIEKLRERLQSGEIDKSEVQEASAALKDLQAQVDHYDEVWNDRCALDCIQARKGLEGHTLGVASIAWRDAEDGGSIGQVISGAQDQTIRLFEVDTNELKKF